MATLKTSVAILLVVALASACRTSEQETPLLCGEEMETNCATVEGESDALMWTQVRYYEDMALLVRMLKRTSAVDELHDWAGRVLRGDYRDVQRASGPPALISPLLYETMPAAFRAAWEAVFKGDSKALVTQLPTLEDTVPGMLLISRSLVRSPTLMIGSGAPLPDSEDVPEELRLSPSIVWLWP